jgi:iron complex outermembrane receptor protein
LGRDFESGGHVTWLDARYDRYVAVGLGGVPGDVAGNRLNNAPEWTGRLWLGWSGRLDGVGRLALTADATAQSTAFYSPFNDRIQRQLPYGLLGARVDYEAPNQRWSLAVYGRNLTNSDYITGAFGNSPAAFGGRPGPPRQVAVEFTIGT